MRITLLGVPGAGKGTQAEILSKRLNLPIVSTGNMLRAAVEAGSPLGLEVKDLIEHGEYVCDQIALELVRERLSQNDCHDGCILDGVPRTVVQADGLEEMGFHVDFCVRFDVPDKIIIHRLSQRRVCPACGDTYHLVNNPPRMEGTCNLCSTPLYIRADDKPETIARRLEVYHSRTAPLEQYYDKRGCLKGIPSCGTVEETTALVLKAIGAQ